MEKLKPSPYRHPMRLYILVFVIATVFVGQGYGMSGVNNRALCGSDRWSVPISKCAFHETAFTTVDSFPFSLRRRIAIKTPKVSTNSSLLPAPRTQTVPYKCNVIFDGRDPATGDRKKELAYESLFSFTASHIKPYLPGNDLLEAECKLFRFNGGYTYLAVKFYWHARNPQSNYGRLKSNGAIRFYLTDKKSVTLYNNQESNWVFNKETKTYEMQALLLLHPRQIKLLQKESVMKASVFWERGFEEYPIYPIAIFKNQLQCLESK